MTIGIGNEFDPGDPPEIHKETAYTIWYKYEYGNVIELQILKETPRTLFVNDRWGGATREMKTPLHFRTKIVALRFAKKRALAEIEDLSQRLEKAKQRYSKYHDALAEIDE